MVRKDRNATKTQNVIQMQTLKSEQNGTGVIYGEVTGNEDLNFCLLRETIRQPEFGEDQTCTVCMESTTGEKRLQIQKEVVCIVRNSRQHCSDNC